MAAAGFGRFQLQLAAVPCLMLAADSMIVVYVSIVRSSVPRHFLPGAHNEAAANEAAMLIPLLAFAGMLAGAPFYGWLSDATGRRASAIACAVVIAVGIFAMAIAPTLTVFYLGTAVSGFGGGGLHVAQTLLAEFVPGSLRESVMAVWGTFWTTGVLFESAVFAFVLHGEPEHWRVLAVFTAVPSIVAALAAYYQLPESPRFLLATGDQRGADRVLQHMASINGSGSATAAALDDNQPRQKPVEYGTAVTPAVGGEKFVVDSSVQPSAAADLPGRLWAKFNDAAIVKLLRLPSIRAVTLRLWVLWLGCTAAYYAALLAAPSAGNGTAREKGLQLVAQALVEYPSYIIQYVIGRNLGRRYGLALCTILTTVAGALWAFALSRGSDGAWQMLAFRLFLMVMFNLLWLMTPESFPTSLRSTGCGACASVSRVAGAFAPLLLVMPQNELYLVSALTSVVAITSALTLPKDTALAPLADIPDEEDDETHPLAGVPAAGAAV